jgi:hypothetical protein
MEPCTTKTTFYHTCAHAYVKDEHDPSCPQYNTTNCTPSGCPSHEESTYIVNSKCRWCTGEWTFPAGQTMNVPQYDEHRKEERREQFERLVRLQMLECEAKASEPMSKRARRE